MTHGRSDKTRPVAILAPSVEIDLFEIWSYLAEDSGTEAADRIESEVATAIEKLSQTPGMGHSRPDLTTANVNSSALSPTLT